VLRAAGACVTGPAHLSDRQDGQDALSLRGWRGGWIAAVADGLGSRANSRTGARLAVQAAQQVTRQLPLQAGAWRDVSAREVATGIYRRWLAAVPWADKSSAATTLLLLACDAQGFARIWQIGDGLVLCRLRGEVQVFTPERTGFGNQTRALGVQRAWSDWHTASFRLRNPDDLVMLMTDGVADDLSAPALDGFTAVVHRELAQLSRRQARRWLTHELTHWATPQHADDKTVAVVFKDK
jgi:serine/threonine protein phosphatase PrpC